MHCPLYLGGTRPRRLGLVGRVLVLDDAREGHVRGGVVDNHRLLEVTALGVVSEWRKPSTPEKSQVFKK